jgi:hypothetical protein
VDTADDKVFTIEAIRNAIGSMGRQKAQVEGGITGEIYKSNFDIFPRYTTALYNERLNRGVFSARWKRVKLIPIIELGKENCEDANKYRSVNLVNIGGKVLENVLINKINHVYFHEFMNNNQFGFMPQRSTINAAMAVKNFVVEVLVAEVIVLVGLDVKGAFDAARWPSILNGLKACE